MLRRKNIYGADEEYRNEHLARERGYYHNRKKPKYVYAVAGVGVLKIGISTHAGQLARTRKAAKDKGFDFAASEMVWSKEGSENLEQFLQACAGRVWGAAHTGGTRGPEWFLIPDLDAASIAAKLDEWHAIYESLSA